MILHANTERAVKAFIEQPSHALLLVGPEGMGKYALAKHVAASILGVSDATLQKLPYIIELRPDKGVIAIEQVRELQASLRLTTTGAAAVRRVVIIEDAQALTTEAQNALLKTLEEPPKDTVLILTTQHLHQLLETVPSRCFVVHVHRLSKVQMEILANIFSKDADSVHRNVALSSGRPGLLHALYDESDGNELTRHIESAKVLLRQPAYERLLQVDAFAKQKEQVSSLLEALLRVSKAGMNLSRTSEAATAWAKRVEVVHDAQKAHAQNANTKLLLTHVFLNL